MTKLADQALRNVVAFYLQPDHLCFPFRLPEPGKKGIRLRKGWVHIVSTDSLEKMGGQHQSMFLCTFPVTILVEGGNLERFGVDSRIRIGKAEARVTIYGDICGAQSQSCGFSEACNLRTEAIMAEIYKEGTVKAGDPMLRIYPD